MKRVLIVDDEFLVRLGLKTTIDWSKYGYTIVGEASNGKEALEMVKKVKPDIIITDIKMPIMDGLTMLGHLPKHIKVAILTNYDDFNYLRKVMELGSAQYMLKSEINEQGLIHLLHKFETTDAYPASYEGENLIKVEQEYAKKLLATKEYQLSRSEVFNKPPYVIYNGVCDTKYLAKDAIEMISKTLSNLVNKQWADSIIEGYNDENKYYFIIIQSVVAFKEGNLQEQIEEQAKGLVNNLKHYFNTGIKIGVSDTGSKDNFLQLLEQADRATRCVFFLQKPVVFWNELPVASDTIPQVSYLKAFSFIDKKYQKELEHYIEEMFEEVKATLKPEGVKSIFIDFLSIAKSICEKNQLLQETGLNSSKFNYEVLEDMQYIDHAKMYVQDLYDMLFNLRQNATKTYSYTIKKCIQYIKQHYNENITLEEVASAIEISCSYLSLLFKQETGFTFSYYLCQYRIEKAKVLLTTTNCKIYEIAEKVGFASPYYFSKVFKDVTQMTCKEYKDQMIEV